MSTHRLVLHEHPFASFCQKPLVALYELGLPFERHIVTDEASRRDLAELWPPAKIPVLRDETAGLTLPESTTIIEYLDGLAPEGPRLVPADAADALQERLWDRFHDQYIAAPMQKIVGVNLRPDGRGDPEGVDEARRTLDTAYAVLDVQLTGNAWTSGAAFTLADCAAAPALFCARVVPAGTSTTSPTSRATTATCCGGRVRAGRRGGPALSRALPDELAAGCRRVLRTSPAARRVGCSR